MTITQLLSPVHLVQDSENLPLILSLYFFFKNAEEITSGGLILYLEKFGLILYFDFLQNIYVVKNTSSEIINSQLVIFIT